jgi:hypothetical protein
MTLLQKYVAEELILTKDEKEFLTSKRNSIQKVMLHNSHLSVKEVRMGGSFEKDVILRYDTDIDIVFVFNKDRAIQWDELMTTLCKDFKVAFPEFTIVEKGENHAVHIIFKKKDQEIKCDVVASYSVNSPQQMSEVKCPELYSGMETVWQTEYFNQYKNKPYFKDVVMLLKDWKKKNDIPLKSFHLELLAAFCYGNCIVRFDSIDYILKFCFRKIQAMLDGKPIVPRKWRYFENSIEYERHYQKPYMINPANPQDNVLQGLSEKDRKLIKKAVSKAVCLIGKNYNEQNYKLILDPNNVNKVFWDQ